MIDQAAERPGVVYTVSELNGSVRLLLSSHFGTVWVEGEISNLAAPSSGHLYFTLKDSDAQVRCAMFRGNARGLGFRPQNGSHVLLRAQVGLYEPRGDYQLIADYLEEAGDGALRRAFEALKRRLAAEGLFDVARKKPIPALPRCVGVITSPSGAAVRDILSVLKRRFPALPVILLPVKVQGSDAKFDIAAAIERADRLQRCDVLIVARGGGSLEDLSAFNEEVVARAMAACSIPIVSGVGHETDVTIADLVADLRAPTPSAAAEAISPDRADWLARVVRLESQLRNRICAQLSRQSQALNVLSRRMQQAHPQKRLQLNAQRLDELELRLRRSIAVRIDVRQAGLAALAARLQRHHPEHGLRLARARQRELRRRLAAAAERAIQQCRQRLAVAGQQLHAISPLATLQRGYAIATRQSDGRILRNPAQIEVGELMETRLADGIIVSRVESRDDPAAPGEPDLH